MKNSFILLFLIVLVKPAGAQPAFGSKESFIPQNWTLLHEAVGDLNRDSLADVAMVVEYAGDALENERPRSLILLLRDKQSKLYSLAEQADHVVLDGQSGGTQGDPFASMEIKNNVLRLDFSGGSREQWTTTHRYRYAPEKYFRVIGATYKVTDGKVTTTYDYNLSNGNIIVTTKDSGNKANNKTTSRKHLLQPVNIRSFEPDAIWALLIPDFRKQVTTCVLQDAGLGDCFHLGFDCGDFGNAETFLDEASATLWQNLTSDSNGDVIANPAYRGKRFEITYITNTGTKCEPQGEDVYQLVIGFKLLAPAPR
ncbi:hypothetical protein [Chryseolinea lacunae]|uniref:VCBS repeat-containing protein n=1 Tax=Chryseolinea lacunae TaxID=2801331 RepID=A0ABS1KN43_9BACT|nr:hypothetical protein [Chryseolinea lacunae]MBL0740667.1 hypothetical protein [Chryseolinea lacunae]